MNKLTQDSRSLYICSAKYILYFQFTKLAQIRDQRIENKDFTYLFIYL